MPQDQSRARGACEHGRSCSGLRRPRGYCWGSGPACPRHHRALCSRSTLSVQRCVAAAPICSKIGDYLLNPIYFIFVHFRGFISGFFLIGDTACRAGLCTSVRAAGARGGGGCQRRSAGPVPAPCACAPVHARAGVGARERVCAAMILPPPLTRAPAHARKHALTQTRAHR
jgi:hypothetical protein